MKKLFTFLFTLLFTFIFSSCEQLNYLFAPHKNTVVYYGIVKQTDIGLCVEIPTIGLCEIPQAERIYSNFENSPTEENYHLQDGNLISISFIRPKTSVKVMKSHPAKFSQSANHIAVLEKYLQLESTENGLILTQPYREELSNKTIGDTIYFLDVGGKDGKAYVRLICSGEITQINSDKVSMLLSIENYPDKTAEFLSLYHQLEQSANNPLA